LKILLLVACLLLPLEAGIVDRLAVIVGQQTITQLQLDEEIRVTALLNHGPIARDVETRRAAADRLVEQLLIRREMEQSRYPLPDEQDVNQYVQQIRRQNGGSAGLAKALATYELSESTLRQHLEAQLVALHFVEYRFRPDAAVSDEDIEAAYRRRAEESKTKPTLEASREPIRAELTEERTDAALSAWLAESRRQVNIVYLDKSLQ
jgi:DNA-binding transcriptional ArsR family regulator